MEGGRFSVLMWIPHTEVKGKKWGGSIGTL